MKISAFHCQALTNLIRHETFEGRDHLVVPCVMMVEGVLNGTEGPALYTANEMKKFPEAWNGIPVPVYHPEMYGRAISANSPAVIESCVVGRTFNTEFVQANGQKAKLRTELWIDVEKSNKIDPTVVQTFESGGHMDVSTGVFTEDEAQSGTYEGDSYNFVATNFRPDHLALLPEAVGACSWDDGAGAPRINKKKENKENKNGMKANIKKAIETINKQLGLRVQELSHDEIHHELRLALKDREGVSPDSDVMVWPVEVFDSFVIYEKDDQNGTKLFKQAYSIDANEDVALVGSPVEVEVKKEFVPITNEKKNKTGMAGNQGDAKNERSPNMDRKERIDALIANEKSNWTEEDRDFLIEIDDSRFEKVVPAVNEEEASAEEKPAEEAKEEKPAEEKPAEAEPKDNGEEKPQTTEEYIANAPEGMRDTLQRSVARDKSIQTGLVTALVANKRCKFTEDQLNVKSIEELQTLSELGSVDVDYGGNNPDLSVNEGDEDDVSAMPVMNWKKEEKKEE